MKTKKILELNVDDLFEMFGRGRIASLSFEKKDGTMRTLTGKIQVNNGVGGEAAYNAKDYGQIRIFDFHAQGWRSVTANKVKEVVSNNIRYIVG